MVQLMGGGFLTVRTFVLAALLLSLVCSSASAGTYLDFSTHQYQRLEPIERFQVDTRIRVHHVNDRAQYGLEYSLFEEIRGPVSDHTLNLYELYWSRGIFRASALLILDGPYDKANPYYGSQLEFKADIPVLRSTWTLEVVPTLRIEAETAELEPIVGLALHRMIGRAEIGLSYNVVEPRDRYLITGSRPVVVATLGVPLWNGSKIALEYGRLLGQTGPERHWWVGRLEFGHLIGF